LQAKYPSSTSPFRVITDIGANLQTTGSIEIDFWNSFGVADLPICTLRSQTSYGLPYLTQCSYVPPTIIYTLTPLNTIPIGRYILEISSFQKNLSPEGLSFPLNSYRVPLSITIKSDAITEASADLGVFNAHPGIFLYYTVIIC